MYKTCNLEFSVDPEIVTMDVDTFRGFVSDQCVPVFWEALNKARTQADLINPAIDNTMRSGEAGISCSGDSHGNVSCEGHVSISW